MVYIDVLTPQAKWELLTGTILAVCDWTVPRRLLSLLPRLIGLLHHYHSVTYVDLLFQQGQSGLLACMARIQASIAGMVEIIPAVIAQPRGKGATGPYRASNPHDTASEA